MLSYKSVVTCVNLYLMHYNNIFFSSWQGEVDFELTAKWESIVHRTRKFSILLLENLQLMQCILLFQTCLPVKVVGEWFHFRWVQCRVVDNF